MKKGEYYYEEKRLEIKKKSREISETNFNSVKERKKRKQEIKDEYRSLKQSEKNEVNKKIRDILDGNDDEMD